MAENIDDLLIKLQEDLKNDKYNIDTVDVEKSMREFKTEVYVKRDQVKQLRVDLDFAQNDAKKLKRELNESNAALDERNFNLNVLNKKFRTTEDELAKTVEVLNNAQMQQKISVVEMEKMKELLQRSEAEKDELFRKVEAFEKKQKQDLLYNNQLIKRDSNLKTTIGKLELAIKNLEQEHKEVIELSKSANVATEAIENYRLLLENYKRLEQEKNNFEVMYIKANAQYETLEKLLNSREYMQESNLSGKLIIDQWESSREHYEEHLEESAEIIKNLIEGYNNEKSVNSKLIEKNAALKEENVNLQTKMELLNKEIECLKQKYRESDTKTPDCSIVIKDEVIEIE